MGSVIYQTADGVAVSIGTVVADPLPDHLTEYVCTEQEYADLTSGKATWDPATLSVVPLPDPADDPVVEAYNVWQQAQAALTPEETNNLNTATLNAEGVTVGDPWRQPTGAQDAYPTGWVVTHNNKSWESLVTANIWEPGVSGWHQVGTEWPDWVQPTGAHDAYPVGAKVTHEGKHWISDVDENVWEPSVYGWTQVARRRS